MSTSLLSFSCFDCLQSAIAISNIALNHFKTCMLLCRSVHINGLICPSMILGWPYCLATNSVVLLQAIRCQFRCKILLFPLIQKCNLSQTLLSPFILLLIWCMLYFCPPERLLRSKIILGSCESWTSSIKTYHYAHLGVFQFFLFFSSALHDASNFFRTRSPKAPDQSADMGNHHFYYAMMPHTGI